MVRFVFLAVQYCNESAYAGLPCQNHPSAEDDGYIKIYSNQTAFAALKADGTITTWGRPVFDHMKQQGAEPASYSTKRSCGLPRILIVGILVVQLTTAIFL
jgi:hypothetical protein